MDLNLYTSKNIFTQKIIWQKQTDDFETLKRKIQKLKQKRQQFFALDMNKRMEIIAEIAEKLKTQKKILAQMICEEVGKCLRECAAEIEKAIDLIIYYTRNAPIMLEPKKVKTRATISEIRFEPLGLILAVLPWNYPIWQILRFAIPTLCAGNACFIKPAPTVGRVTEFFFQQLVNPIIPIDYILLDNKDVELAIQYSDGMAFTGSVATGRKLASTAGNYLKKMVLELGGSNAFIVFADADLEKAAKDACYSRFRDAGQSCNSAKRIIIEESCAEIFIAYLMEEVKKISLGNPMLNETRMGPLHMENASQTMQLFVDDAISKGAECLIGGFIPSNPIFYPPTLLKNVALASLVVQEEVFGPVLPILKVKNREEAIAVANHTSFGLGAAIYSQDIQSARRYAQQLEVGSVYINRHTSSDLRMPFGGIKNSGLGRELSEFGLIEFVNIKSYWQR